MKGAVLADWVDELEDWPVADVRWSLRQWRSEFPSRKPNPAHISKILKDARGRELASGGKGFKENPATIAARAERDGQTTEERKAISKQIFKDINYNPSAWKE